MDVREQKQEELVEIGYEKKRGIILASMRMGKTRVGVKILQKMEGTPRVLISYPDIKIKAAWVEEFEKMGYSNPNLVLSSTRSLHKYELQEWDVIFVDECWKLSDRNIQSLQCLLEPNRSPNFALFFTGSLPDGVEKRLSIELKISLVASYLQEEAIEDEIVSDYRINIVSVALDNQRLIQYKKNKRTEKQQFNAYSGIIRKLEAQERDTFHLRLARMRIIQNSISKMETTRKLIRKFKGERLLVFCGLIKVAEQLGIPTEHSKADNGNMVKFQNGEINELAVIRMGASGVTFKGLDRVIISYFDSNEATLQQKIGRAMNLGYKGKIADIWIVTSTEDVEKRWLEKALKPFEASKIFYINKF